MKSFLQVGLPIVILMAVVGVVAYVTQNTSRPVEIPTINKLDGQPPQTNGDPIVFDADPVDLDARATDVEYMQYGHRDFWFHTKQPLAVSIHLDFKSCTCTNAEVGEFAISTAEWEALAKSPSLAGWCRLAGSAVFRPLIYAPDAERVSVEGSPAGTKPKPCILRINWQAKQTPNETTTPERLRVRLSAQVGDGVPSIYEKEVAYTSVLPVALWPQKLDLGELTEGSRRAIECTIWSVTRDHLSFHASLFGPGKNDAKEPCADVSSPVQLTGQELEELPEHMGPDYSKLRLRCAYRFTLTLFERRGDKQLDLGPLTRRLKLTFVTQPEESRIDDLSAAVTGLVRGSVRVLNGDGNDRIALGSFKYDRTKTYLVRLGTLDPKLELAVETTSDPKLKATLGAPKMVGGRKEWEMEVVVEPNAFLGELQPLPVIQLLMKGPNPRRIRIPVTGTADR